MKHSLLFLNGDDVDRLLHSEEKSIVEIIEMAYVTYCQGNAVLPESSFLQFPDMQYERIIALPAYLGEPFNCAGIKWISSFPNNINKKLERASALYVLNSLQTGHPIAVMESSIISAKRTAASAVLASAFLVSDKQSIKTISIIGSGLINYETVILLLNTFSYINKIFIYDIDLSRSLQFQEVLIKQKIKTKLVVCKRINELICESQIICIATSAIEPYIHNLYGIQASAIILHISLRDLFPEIIKLSNNVVDDINHACRANTSLHLACKSVSPSMLINCTIGDLILNGKDQYITNDLPIIVSPFGLGILDLALAKFIYEKAIKNGVGMSIGSFLPEPWFNRAISGS